MAARKKADGQSMDQEAVARLLKSYESVVMKRSDIQGADYNPRIMSDEKRKRLRIAMEKHGNLQPPNVNKRSVEKGWPAGSKPTLMGGHQRMQVWDTVIGRKDYELEVALADKTPAEEKECNLILNNEQAQGDWDLTKLESMLSDQTIALAGTGFDMADVFQLFGDMPGAQSEDLTAMAEELRAVRDKYKQNVSVKREGGGTDFYIVVVFRDYEQRVSFLEKAGMDDNRYQAGTRLAEMLGFDLGPAPALPVSRKRRATAAPDTPPADPKAEPQTAQDIPA